LCRFVDEEVATALVWRREPERTRLGGMSDGGTRRLATVMFTDMVGSTEIAAKLGDARWRELLRRHHVIVRRDLKRFGGREIDTAGDGVFAIFDVPAQAVRCACAIAEETQELGVDIRAGLHVGEVEVAGKEVRGIAVHTGSRVCAIAGPTDVLVTSTLTELVGGAGIEFEGRGVHSFKGVPGQWHVLNVTNVAEATRPEPLDPATAEERLALVEPPPFVRRKGAWISGAAVILLVIAAGGVYLGTRKSPPKAVSRVPLYSVVQVDPSTGKVLATIPHLIDSSGKYPIQLDAGEGAIWLLNGPNLIPVDAQTKQAASPIALGTQGVVNRSIGVGYQTVWIGVFDGLARVDPATDQVLNTIKIHGSASSQDPTAVNVFNTNSVAVGAGVVWATSDQKPIVARVDPHTGQVTQVSLKATGDGVAVGDNTVWVINNVAGVLWRIDPTSGKVTGNVSLSGNLADVVAGGGAVWVLDTGAGTVIPVSSTTLHPLVPIRVGNGPSDIAFGLGAVWVTNQDDGTISRIDATSKEVTTIKIGSPVAAIAVDAASETLWVAIAPKPTNQ
jgi:class 3 adenylate cyclase